MKRILLAALAAFSLPAMAGVVGAPASFGMGGPEISTAEIPAPAVGHAVERIKLVTTIPAKDSRGSFRTNCKFSHVNFDDRMVYPYGAGKSHAHVYAGNTASNAMADFDADNILNVGNSTCSGGIANRSSYWSPTIVDTRTGKPVPMTAFGGYYKAGYDLPIGTQFVVPPTGLRILTGSMHNTSPNGPFKYTCTGKIDGVTVNYTQQSIPNCPVGTTMKVTVAFPQCWNGVDLDSPDHKSHVVSVVANPAGGRMCPSTHPHAIPKIEFNWDYPVTEADAPLHWRVSSDMHADVPAGYSMHADWWNGWRPDVIRSWVQNCLNTPKNCEADQLGDGRVLY